MIMAFKKGKSGNPKGRPRGSINSQTRYIRECVISVIGSKSKNLLSNFDSLSVKEQWRVISSLLPYVLPRQTAANINATIDFERLTDEQLNDIVSNLVDNILNEEDM
jgi:hypothetical protein